MDNRFLEYQTFASESDLNEFVIRLDKNNIPYAVEKYASGLDSTYLGAGAVQEFSLKMPKDRFEEVNRLLEKEAEDDFHLLMPEYFLFDFSDAELREVISQPREWFRKDVVYAGKILEQRGVAFSISELRERIEEEKVRKRKPQRANKVLLVGGYISVFCAIFLSTIIGYYLAFSTFTDEGKKYWTFVKNDRKHGKIILYAGIVRFLILWTWLLSFSGMFDYLKGLY